MWLNQKISSLPPDVARAIELLEKLQESGDVPGHKLQSLKKVLQSEFCTAIREVSRLQRTCTSPVSRILIHMSLLHLVSYFLFYFESIPLSCQSLPVPVCLPTCTLLVRSVVVSITSYSDTSSELGVRYLSGCLHTASRPSIHHLQSIHQGTQSKPERSLYTTPPITTCISYIKCPVCCDVPPHYPATRICMSQTPCERIVCSGSNAAAKSAE